MFLTRHKCRQVIRMSNVVKDEKQLKTLFINPYRGAPVYTIIKMVADTHKTIAVQLMFVDFLVLYCLYRYANLYHGQQATWRIFRYFFIEFYFAS